MKKIVMLLTLVAGPLLGRDIPSARPQWVLQNRLVRAIRRQYIPYIKQRIKDGADLNSMTRKGVTPLGAAAAHGNVQTVKYLIDHGAQVNRQDSQGRTPLMRAAQYGRRFIVRFLLDNAHADTAARDTHGRTARDIAQRFGHPNITRMITQHS